MSLADKVIKNTYYFTLSQIINFIFGLILTPLIIAHIGTTAFAIYALVLGFAGIFGLFDMSISTSFVKFISEHYNKKEYDELNHVINTGMVFYFSFSLIAFLIGYIFMDKLLGLLNINPDFLPIARLAFILGLISFSVVNTFGIFNSILVSLQKMYLTSLVGIILTAVNFVSVIMVLHFGYGLEGLLWLHMIMICISIVISIYYAVKALPDMKINLKLFHFPSLKKMTKFGAQMQVSKLSQFAGDKYDEFLLAFFSVIGNVTYYNISLKVARAGRSFPYLLVPQVAPVAAELNAKSENKKIIKLFADTTKYLTMISVPIFMYIFIYADVIIETWVGEGFDISVQILRILAVGQLCNMIFSAPGNSITPHLGVPRFQMNEGLLYLLLNVVLSYVFIKNFGITGAAFGNSISMSMASFFVFWVTSNYFKYPKLPMLKGIYLKPFISLLLAFLTSYPLLILIQYLPFESNRLTGIITITITGFVFISVYAIALFHQNYLDSENKLMLLKAINRIFPLRYLINLKNNESEYTEKKYTGELVSIFVITRNRLDFLKKCLNSLLPTLRNINYELIVWDNNSTDGTKEFLHSLQSNKIKVIFSEKNIGTNAKGKAAELCKGEFIVGIDDDVLEFPEGWLESLIRAYKTVPKMGYLSTDVIQNDYTNGAKPPDEFYRSMNFGSFEVQFGPAGGWCFIISREIYKKTGKFAYLENRIFAAEDGDYTNRIINRGYKCGILKGVKVFHATGEYYNRNYMDIYREKMRDIELSPSQDVFGRIKNMLNLKNLYYKFLNYAERKLPE